jgi:drug/metabolite transporter (DMT)-like permease
MGCGSGSGFCPSPSCGAAPSSFFAKVAIGELGPLTVVFARVALAALALDIVLLATGTNPFRRDAPWSACLAMGLLNNVLPFSLIFWGQTEIASGLAIS